MQEFGRLIGAGLSAQAALRVLGGELDEFAAIAQAEEARAVAAWMDEQPELPARLEPQWDLAPERFHLALDGESAADKRFTHFAVIEADIAEVAARLTFASTRKEGPWAGTNRIKTAKTAYRWSASLAVTPPLICIHKGELHMEGGMHRFHLAKHYRAARIPLLVDRAILPTVLGMLPSASILLGKASGASARAAPQS